LIVAVEDPDPGTLAGEKVSVSPFGTVADNVTVPVKPFWPVMVMVDCPELP